MNNVINLNKFRKAKTKADKEKRAEENRTRYGQSKTEKSANKKLRKKSEQFIDNHKMDENTPDKTNINEKKIEDDI